MSLTLDNNTAGFQIRGYKPGSVQINETIYHRSVIVSAQKMVQWAPQSVAELNADCWGEVLELKPSILLIGTGPILVFPPIEVYGHLINAGIGVEVMDTSGACRTYNALTAEDREVVAALLL